MTNRVNSVLEVATAIVFIGLVAFGCSSFTNNVERTTETATHLAYGAYVGWTNAVNQNANLNQYTPIVHDARLKFTASVNLVDTLNASYQTNGVSQSFVQAALDTVLANSSNLVWTVNYLKGH